MLDALKKKLTGSIPDEQLEKVANVEQELAAQLQEAIGSLEQLNAVVAEKDAALQMLNAKLEELSKYAEAAEAQAAALAEEAKLKAENARKEQLAAVIGKDNPSFDEQFNALSVLSDEAFGVVVKGFAAANTKQAESDTMFQQESVSVEANDVEDTSFDFSKFK